MRWTNMNAINKEYEHLMKQIQLLTEKWRKQLDSETLTTENTLLSINQFPVIPQVELSVNSDQYRSFIIELLSLLKELQPTISMELDKVEATLSDEILQQWFKEAIAVNNFYFEQFAQKKQLAEWLPFFVAEHAVRPYLQKAAVEMTDVLKKAKGHTGCPACGEPARLAVINKNAKKEITCPRCHYAWEQKKISCAHCGTDEPGKIEILKIEQYERAEIYVCQECKGYTKVVDARKLMKVEAPEILDLKSIHLDYVAQENGFGIPEIKGKH